MASNNPLDNNLVRPIRVNRVYGIELYCAHCDEEFPAVLQEQKSQHIDCPHCGGRNAVFLRVDIAADGPKSSSSEQEDDRDE